ncbi:MAG: phospholipase [Tannerella sp.]|jgi:hypothetical protein|nr:phospholipase [Tannerella sp.]
MWYIVCSLFMLGFISAGMSFRESRKRQRTSGGRGETTASAEARTIPDDCCGLHDVCERDRLQAVAGKKVEYYDDEELDAYCGIASDAYPEMAVDEFREVFYTLREAEVAGWIRSLQVRGIHLPDSLKDEAFLIIGENKG